MKPRTKKPIAAAKRPKVAVEPSGKTKPKKAARTTLAVAKPKNVARGSNSPKKVVTSPKTAAKTTSRAAKAVATKRVAKPSRKRREPGVHAVLQPDGVSCGWATTKWLLDSFGVLDVTDRQLRTELNTDAERGVRAWWNSRIASFVNRKFGKDWEAGEGTLPMAIFSALRKRGIVLKNPVRLERFSNFTDYLYDTFREGGRAAILLWRMDGLLHWMGVDRQKGAIRIMDPARGRYVPFQRGIEYWESGDRKPNFLVFGFVRA